MCSAPAHGRVMAQSSYGPHIKVTADGEAFFEGVLRDNEEVSRKQLGGYLSRLAFKGTDKLPIRADEKKADRATVRAKFELRLSRKGEESRPVFTMTFDELRLARSKSDADV